MASLVGIAGYELHRLFPSKPEGALQLQAHAHVLVLYLTELFFCDVLGFALVGNESPVRNTVMFVRVGNDISLVDLRGPPSDRCHPVLDRTCREVLVLPMMDQGLDVLRLE